MLQNAKIPPTPSHGPTPQKYAHPPLPRYKMV